MKSFVPEWGVKQAPPKIVQNSSHPNPSALPKDQEQKITQEYYAKLGNPTQRALDYGATDTDPKSNTYNQKVGGTSAEAQAAKRVADGQTEREWQSWARGDLEGTLDRFDPHQLEIVELDDAAYEKLSQAEKDAVDYNTALYNANQADKTAVRPGDLGDYQQEYARTFAGAAPAETYNPNLLKVLGALDITDAYGSLDDYTSMRAAILASDFNALNSNREETAAFDSIRDIPAAGGVVASATENAATTERQKLVQQLANQTRNLKERMDAGALGMDFSLYGDFSDRVGAYINRELNQEQLVTNRQTAAIQAAMSGGDQDEAAAAYTPEGTYKAVLARMTSSAEAQNWTKNEVARQLQEMGLNFDDFKKYAAANIGDTLTNDFGDGADPVPVDWLRKQLGL